MLMAHNIPVYKNLMLKTIRKWMKHHEQTQTNSHGNAQKAV